MTFALGKLIFAHAFGAAMHWGHAPVWLRHGAGLYYVAGLAVGLCVPVAMTLPVVEEEEEDTLTSSAAPPAKELMEPLSPQRTSRRQ